MYTSAENINLEFRFKGRAWVAAVNSSASITISGDSDAIDEIHAVLQDEKKFARRLRVNRAYHSPHMQPYSTSYDEYQKRMSIEISPPSRCVWYSSVTGQDNSVLQDELKGPYWIDNLLNPVLFKQAVEKAWSDSGPFDLAVEIGPHPALRGPVQQIVQDLTDRTIPYAGLFQRGMSDIESLAEGLGYISCHAGKGVVDFKALEAFLSDCDTFQPLQGLPPYSWNHNTEYWHESRYTRAITHRSDKVHDLLGHLTPDSSDREMRWRHSTSPKELPWLSGHRVQGQTVFPGAAFIVTVVEACLKITKGQPVSLIEVLDITMGQALTFDDDDTPAEIVFALCNISRQDEPPCITGTFNCSAAKSKGGTSLDSLAHGKFRILLGEPSDTALPGGSSRPTSLLDVNADDFYTSLDSLEYEFSGPFIALSNLKRKLGLSTGFLPGVNAPSMLIHPAMLDALFQSIILAASAPNDGRMWTAHIPNHIDAVRVNPSLCEAQRESTVRPAFEGSCELNSDMSYVMGNSRLFPEGSEYSMISVERVNLVALSRATADNDRVIFSSHSWGPASPDIGKTDVADRSIPGQYAFTQLLQRVAYFHLRNLEKNVPLDHPCRHEGPYTSIFHYASHTLKAFKDGAFSVWSSEWEADNSETIEELLHDAPSTPDSELLRAMGPRLADIVMGNASPIDIGMQGDLLAKYYEGAFGMPESLDRLAQTVGQIVHRHPRIRCLEVGAGTGTATQVILRENGLPFSEYTFTDISSGFFPSAKSRLGKYGESMVFKPFDISKDPSSQGFEPHSYDLIVASLVLHATPSLKHTLNNVRRLLKPGGYLIAVEIQKNIPAHIGAIFGAFSGWWLGAEDGRLLSPCIDVSEWENILCQTGFSGCDSSAFESDPMVHPATIFISQAIDERISFFRNPFGNEASSSTIIPNLILFGGETNEASSVISQLTSLLQPYCATIAHKLNLNELEALSVDSDTFVVSLMDLDQPIFQQPTEDIWESLKSILQQAGSLVWVTRGRRAERPHSNMMVGIMRSALNEIPNISSQFLDFENESQMDAKVLGEAILQFAKAIKLRKEDRFSDILHTVEPELIFRDKGTVVVPRLKTEQAMNDRYNASRRLVPTSIPTAEASISLGPAKSGYYVRSSSTSIASNTSTSAGRGVQVAYSSLSPLRLNRRSSLFWSIGRDIETKSPVLALSLLNEQVVSPLISTPIPVSSVSDDEMPKLLHLVILCQISSLVLGDLGDGDRVLTHDLEPLLSTLIWAEGQKRGVEVVCTTTHDRASSDRLKLHPNAPEWSIKALQPESISVFVDFGSTGESRRVSDRITRQLDATCRRENVQSLFDGTSRSLSVGALGSCPNVLDGSIQTAIALSKNVSESDINVIRLADIDLVKSELAYRNIIDWTTENSVPALIEPVDTHSIFSNKKTYWLVGLTGSLGLSLCEWMVRSGARHIAISSRSPNVEVAWLQMMASKGANIKVNSWWVFSFS